MTTLVNATACWSDTERAISRGAAPNTSTVGSGAVSGPSRSHCTNAAMPAWATSITQERWSGGIVLNHGSFSSMRATAWVAIVPEVRSTRRMVAASGGLERAGCDGRDGTVRRLPRLMPRCRAQGVSRTSNLVPDHWLRRRSCALLGAIDAFPAGQPAFPGRARPVAEPEDGAPLGARRRAAAGARVNRPALLLRQVGQQRQQFVLEGGEELRL